MANVDQAARSKLPTITAVALIHIGIGYAFITGLAQSVITEVMPVFRVESVPDLQSQPPDPTPPPPAPRAAVPDQVTVVEQIAPLPAMPTVRIDALPTIDVTAPPGPVLPVPHAEPAPPPPPAAQATTARPRGDKGQWITAGDYPAAALRAGDEGVVGIDARGRVGDCRITQ